MTKYREIQEVLNRWLWFEARINDNRKYVVGYKYLPDTKELIIYTDKPGILIGYHGKCVNKLKEMLKEAGYEVTIDFAELWAGHFKEVDK